MSAGTTRDVASSTRPLRFGLSPALSGEVAYRVGTALSRLLGVRLETHVQPMVFSDYEKLEVSLVQGRVDFAWTPPASFVEVAAEGCGLLALMERGGKTAFESALLVRSDGDLATLNDLRHTTAAWVDPRSASGYVVALAGLLEALGDTPPQFAGEQFYGSHCAACGAVLAGRADFCATYTVRNDAREVIQGGWLTTTNDGAEATLQPLAFFGPIPADAIAHSPRLPLSDIELLRDVLTRLHEEEEGRQVISEVFSATRLSTGDSELFDTLAWAGIEVERYRAKHPL